jgi:hypothetical protein
MGDRTVPVYLAVVSEQFPERVTDRRGPPIALDRWTPPAAAETPAARRLADRLAAAVRTLRLRLAGTPAGRDAPLRVAVLSTLSAGTKLDAEVAPLALQSLDLDAAEGRAALLDAVRRPRA